MPGKRRLPPIFLQRCLRGRSEAARRFRGSSTLTKACCQLDSAYLTLGYLVVPRLSTTTAGCSGGVLVALAPRLSSKLSVRYSVLAHCPLRAAVGNAETRLNLEKPLVIDCSTAAGCETIVVAVLVMQSALTPAKLTKVEACLLEQLRSFASKAKPPANMQVALRSGLKAAGLGAGPLEFCVLGRFASGALPQEALVAPTLVPMHSKLYNALSGLARDSVDPDEAALHPVPTTVTNGATLSSPAPPPAIVSSLLLRPSFHDVMQPQPRVLSTRVERVLAELTKAATAFSELCSARTGAASSGIGAGSKRAREPVVAVEAMLLLPIARHLRAALSSCLFPSCWPPAESLLVKGLDAVASATRVAGDTSGSTKSNLSSYAALGVVGAHLTGAAAVARREVPLCGLPNCLYSDSKPSPAAAADATAVIESPSPQERSARLRCECHTRLRRGWLDAYRIVAASQAPAAGVVRPVPDAAKWAEACVDALRTVNLLTALERALSLEADPPRVQGAAPSKDHGAVTAASAATVKAVSVTPGAAVSKARSFASPSVDATGPPGTSRLSVPDVVVRASGGASSAASNASSSAALAVSPASPSGRPSSALTLSPSFTGGRRTGRPTATLAVSLQAALVVHASLEPAFAAAAERGQSVRCVSQRELMGSGRSLPPAGRYIHGNSGIPVTPLEDPIDSGDELDTDWLHAESAARLAALDDVPPDDKAVMLLWNDFMRTKYVSGEIDLPQAFLVFVRRHARQLAQERLHAALLRMLLSQWDRAVLDAESLATCVAAALKGAGDDRTSQLPEKQ
jgi:hypothetical protein